LFGGVHGELPGGVSGGRGEVDGWGTTASMGAMISGKATIFVKLGHSN